MDCSLAEDVVGHATSPFVDHEKERWQLGPTFASSPPARQGDGRGQRRGLDGPTLPRPTKKLEEVFVPTTGRNRRCGGLVLGETPQRPSRALAAGIRSRRARPANQRGRISSGSPRNPAVQAGFSASQASSQVRGRRDAARAAPSARSVSHPHFNTRPPATQRGQPQAREACSTLTSIREAFNPHFNRKHQHRFQKHDVGAVRQAVGCSTYVQQAHA